MRQKSWMGVSDSCAWAGGNTIPQYNVCRGAIIRIMDMRGSQPGMSHLQWSYRTPKEAQENRKPWINTPDRESFNGALFSPYVPGRPSDRSLRRLV
jgi:hypothetical protein